MPQLAESFRKISRHGKDIFYKGELAKQIVDGNNKLGGIFTILFICIMLVSYWKNDRNLFDKDSLNVR